MLFILASNLLSSRGWSWTLVLLPPSKCWGYRCVPLHLGAEGQTQGFMHARQSVLPTELCFQNTDSLSISDKIPGCSDGQVCKSKLNSSLALFDLMCFPQGTCSRGIQCLVLFVALCVYPSTPFPAPLILSHHQRPLHLHWCGVVSVLRLLKVT